MVKARYYKADGKKARAKVALPEALFDGVVNEDAMHRAVKAYLSNQRRGTGAAKNRSAVEGGNSKPWRQKGTGRARQGSIRAPHWEGGGRAFPPIPHSWREKLPKKVRSLARRSALNDRAANDRLVVADLPEIDRPKTKELVGFLSAVGAEGKVLILTDGKDETVFLSSRNLPDVSVCAFGTESVYDVLWADTVVIERSAVARDGAKDTEPAEEASDA